MANLAIFKSPELYKKIEGKISFYILTQEVNIFIENSYFDRRKLTE